MTEATDLILPFPVANRKLKRRGVYVGAIVVVLNTKLGDLVTGQVVEVHPPDVEMKDKFGDRNPWSGRWPVIDVLCVSLDPDEDEDGSHQTLVSRVTMLAHAADVRRQGESQGLPGGLSSTWPCYKVIDKLEGKDGD